MYVSSSKLKYKNNILTAVLFIKRNKKMCKYFVLLRKGDNSFQGLWVKVRVKAFNATFNNISVISWRSVLLVEETPVPGENHRPTASHCQILSHTVVSSTPRLSEIQTHNVSGDRH
jgi:hypothetical protein